MRCLRMIGVLGGLLLCPALGWSQSVQELAIAYPEIKVYSGPSIKFYPTSKLRAGDKVQVVATADRQPGWLAIKPPPGSFSWISQRFVHLSPDGKIGTVIADNSVPVLPGSSLINDAPNVDKLKVQPGTLVVILDKPLVASSGVWLPIQPPAGEVRYIESYAVQAPALATTPRTPAQLASMTKPAGHPDNTTGMPTYAGGWQAGNQAPGPMTSLYNKNPATQMPPCNPPQWANEIGVLRKTAFQMNGTAMYALENSRGEALLYATPRPGYTLSPYVGRTVRLYGSMSYRSDDYLRRYYLTATYVQLIP